MQTVFKVVGKESHPGGHARGDVGHHWRAVSSVQRSYKDRAIHFCGHEARAIYSEHELRGDSRE